MGRSYFTEEELSKLASRKPYHRYMSDSQKNELIKELKVALLSMCKYANHLGEELAKRGNGNYCGDFVAQHKELLDA